MTTTAIQQLPTIVPAYSGSTAFMFDKRSEDFRLISNTPLARNDVLLPVPLLYKEEERIPGTEYEARAMAKRACLAGQHHAELILKQPAIAHKWRDAIYAFFGTEWRGQCECRPIPCLKKSKGQLCIFFLYLGDMFTPEFLLVLLTNRQPDPFRPRLFVLE